MLREDRRVLEDLGISPIGFCNQFLHQGTFIEGQQAARNRSQVLPRLLGPDDNACVQGMFARRAIVAQRLFQRRHAQAHVEPAGLESQDPFVNRLRGRQVPTILVATGTPPLGFKLAWHEPSLEYSRRTENRIARRSANDRRSVTLQRHHVAAKIKHKKTAAHWAAVS